MITLRCEINLNTIVKAILTPIGEEIAKEHGIHTYPCEYGKKFIRRQLSEIMYVFGPSFKDIGGREMAIESIVYEQS